MAHNKSDMTIEVNQTDVSVDTLEIIRQKVEEIPFDNERHTIDVKGTHFDVEVEIYTTAIRDIEPATNEHPKFTEIIEGFKKVEAIVYSKEGEEVCKLYNCDLGIPLEYEF